MSRLDGDGCGAVDAGMSRAVDGCCGTIRCALIGWRCRTGSHGLCVAIDNELDIERNNTQSSNRTQRVGEASVLLQYSVLKMSDQRVYD